MAAFKPLDGQTTSETFQSARDTLDVVGRWEWDAGLDRVRADASVALVHNVDPIEAEEGVPLGRYFDSIHADDRARGNHGSGDSPGSHRHADGGADAAAAPPCSPRRRSSRTPTRWSTPSATSRRMPERPC